LVCTLAEAIGAIDGGRFPVIPPPDRRNGAHPMPQMGRAMSITP